MKKIFLLLLLSSPLFAFANSPAVLKVIIYIVHDGLYPVHVQVRMDGSNFTPSTIHGDKFNLPSEKTGMPIAFIENSEELEKFYVYVGKNVGVMSRLHLSKITKDGGMLQGYDLWENLPTAFMKSDYVLNSKIDEEQIKSGKTGFKKTTLFFSKVQ